MAGYIALSAIDAVVGGVEVSVAAAYVELKDAVTGYDGPGSYHVQIQRSTGRYVVTVGLPPGDTSDLMRISRAVQDPSGRITLHDVRNVNVGMLGVNSTIMQSAVDGSYLANDVIVPRNFAPGTFEALLDSIGDTEGDILIRGATAWEVLAPGTTGYVLTMGSALPEWSPAAASGVASLNGETGAVVLESTGSTVAITEPDSTHINLEAKLTVEQLTDVDVTSIANGQVLVWNSGASKWENATPSAGGVTSVNAQTGAVVLGSVGGTVGVTAADPSAGDVNLEAILSVEKLTDVTVTSIANGQVLAWNSTASKWENVTPSAGGVTSVNGETGALTIESLAGSVQITEPDGTHINLEAELSALTDVVLTSPANQDYLRYNGTDWVNLPLTVPTISSLPTAGSTYSGRMVRVLGGGAGTPDKFYICRQRQDGTYIWTRFQGRSCILAFASGEFTPSTTGKDVIVREVPYDPEEPGSPTVIAWTVVDIVFRIETAAASGTTSLKVQRSTGTGIFSNVGYLNTTSLDILATTYEPASGQKPCPLAVTSINSGDKLSPEYVAIAGGSAGYSAYVVLRES